MSFRISLPDPIENLGFGNGADLLRVTSWFSFHPCKPYLNPDSQAAQLFGQEPGAIIRVKPHNIGYVKQKTLAVVITHLQKGRMRKPRKLQGVKQSEQGNFFARCT